MSRPDRTPLTREAPQKSYATTPDIDFWTKVSDASGRTSKTEPELG